MSFAFLSGLMSECHSWSDMTTLQWSITAGHCISNIWLHLRMWLADSVSLFCYFILFFIDFFIWFLLFLLFFYFLLIYLFVYFLFYFYFFYFLFIYLFIWFFFCSWFGNSVCFRFQMQSSLLSFFNNLYVFLSTSIPLFCIIKN